MEETPKIIRVKVEEGLDIVVQRCCRGITVWFHFISKDEEKLIKTDEQTEGGKGRVSIKFEFE